MTVILTRKSGMMKNAYVKPNNLRETKKALPEARIPP